MAEALVILMKASGNTDASRAIPTDEVFRARISAMAAFLSRKSVCQPRRFDPVDYIAQYIEMVQRTRFNRSVAFLRLSLGSRRTSGPKEHSGT